MKSIRDTINNFISQFRSPVRRSNDVAYNNLTFTDDNGSLSLDNNTPRQVASTDSYHGSSDFTSWNHGESQSRTPLPKNPVEKFLYNLADEDTKAGKSMVTITQPQIRKNLLKAQTKSDEMLQEISKLKEILEKRIHEGLMDAHYENEDISSALKWIQEEINRPEFQTEMSGTLRPTLELTTRSVYKICGMSRKNQTKLDPQNAAGPSYIERMKVLRGVSAQFSDIKEKQEKLEQKLKGITQQLRRENAPVSKNLFRK